MKPKRNKSKLDTNGCLVKIYSETEKKEISRKVRDSVKNQSYILLKNALKFTEEEAEVFLLKILTWVEDNPDAVTFRGFFRTYNDNDVVVGKYSTVLYLTNKYPKCKEVYEEILETIKERLILRGLDRTYAENFTKFILGQNYNMHDVNKTDVTTNGKSINPVTEIKLTCMTKKEDLENK